VRDRFSDGSISGKVSATKFTVGSRSIALDQVRRIEHRPLGDVTVTLENGEQVSGTPGGLDSVRVRMGRASVLLDLSRAESLTVEAPADSSAGPRLFAASTLKRFKQVQD
jgi:hypothetical protein